MKVTVNLNFVALVLAVVAIILLAPSATLTFAGTALLYILLGLAVLIFLLILL